MPRIPRRESVTGVYHIIIRGNNRNWILRKEEHKLKMRHLILNQEDLSLIDLYAWCIMDNHVHLVVQAQKESMFKAMWNINRLFARYYNEKEKSVGHVFENRYKSEVIESDQYMKQVIRYVHNNPVKAKIVKQANAYQWSSYRTYLVGGNKPKDMKLVEAYFNNELQEFIEYHNAEDDQEYMDIHEDLMILREEKAQKIISQNCKMYNISSIYEIHRQVQLRDKIIEEIIKKSKLPLRRIAEMTGLSYSSIQNVYVRAMKWDEKPIDGTRPQ